MREPLPVMCPSAQQGMKDLQLIGVVTFDGDEPREVFRMAGQCEELRCTHFNGTDCKLATRIVQILPAVVDGLPPCLIRASCRWYTQEGKAACLRCPQVVT